MSGWVTDDAAGVKPKVKRQVKPKLKVKTLKETILFLAEESNRRYNSLDDSNGFILLKAVGFVLGSEERLPKEERKVVREVIQKEIDNRYNSLKPYKEFEKVLEMFK